MNALYLTVLLLAQSAPYPTSSRIQIAETCEIAAKWLTQALAPGQHWQLLQYNQDLGLLSFKLSDLGLSRADAREYTESSKGGIHAYQITFTLRSQVKSSIDFGNGRSSGEACTIAAAVKFVAKGGATISSRGRLEGQILWTLKDRYERHGLDY